ncbi:MAG: response regulator transcription factor [Deltaproteobacteria bacterium]|nr:response regulator transcription factor [Deltaproteobacteria bacterium]
MDDQTIFREMLAQILVTKLGAQIVGEFSTAAAAVAELPALAPALLVVDVVLPDGSGLDVVARLKNKLPHTRVLVLTASERLEVTQQASQLGVHGIVMKGVSLADLQTAVETVARGGAYYCPTSLRLLRLTTHGPAGDELTVREKQVAMMIARGKSSKAIASELQLSVKTVGNHRLHVMKKLGASNAADVTRHAIERGWL